MRPSTSEELHRGHREIESLAAALESAVAGPEAFLNPPSEYHLDYLDIPGGLVSGPVGKN